MKEDTKSLVATDSTPKYPAALNRMIQAVDDLAMAMSEDVKNIPGVDYCPKEDNSGIPYADFVRWMNLLERGHLSIEIAEEIEQTVIDNKYGFITLAIEGHEITRYSGASSSKVTSRRGRRILQQTKHKGHILDKESE